MLKTVEQTSFRFIPDADRNIFARPFINLLENVSGLNLLQKKYGELAPSEEPGQFLDQVLGYLKVNCQVSPEDISRIPKSGSVIIVANHPFGALDGLVLAQLLLKIRPDIRILANHMLKRIPGMNGLLFGCDPFGRNRARNQTSLRQALRWLKQEGVLLVFPAGEVSHFHLSRGKVVDPEWRTTVGRLVLLSGAPVVPLFIHGRNSNIFQVAGMVHPLLRTLMLPRELLRHGGSNMQISIGKPVFFNRLKRLGSEKEITAYLRLCTCTLGEAQHRPETRLVRDNKAKPDLQIIRQTPEELQKSEIKYLPESQLLIKTGCMEVYYAKAAQIPWVLQEIGRLREITFRAAGEGTGKAADIDLYDTYYLHLFVWNAGKGEIVGAYRLGLADEILGKYGKRGLYTHSLFRYKSGVLSGLHQAIELGRSFIRAEYQCSFLALNLLWQGIGVFVSRLKRYPILFGPVSISNEYDRLSRKFMIDCLRLNQCDPELSAEIKPRKPFRHNGGRHWKVSDLAMFSDAGLISEFVSQLENDNKGMPVLFRQYLKLGGKFLCFNVDDEFSNVVDGLIMVDLRKTGRRVLEKYMGSENAAAFLQYHGVSGDGPQRDA
jgi:putative hemolysin